MNRSKKRIIIMRLIDDLCAAEDKAAHFDSLERREQALIRGVLLDFAAIVVRIPEAWYPVINWLFSADMEAAARISRQLVRPGREEGNGGSD